MMLYSIGDRLFTESHIFVQEVCSWLTTSATLLGPPSFEIYAHVQSGSLLKTSMNLGLSEVWHFDTSSAFSKHG